MTQELEKLQISALKIVFGYRTPSVELTSLAGLTMLEERRKTLFRSFCLKTQVNQRFKAAWLEEKEFVDYALRKQHIIKEHFARTERLYKSLLFTMRRELNDINVT